MKLKPFNFEEWQIDNSQPGYTKEGKLVSELHFFNVTKTFPLIGFLEKDSAYICWTKEGNYWGERVCDEYDLMLVEKDGASSEIVIKIRPKNGVDIGFSAAVFFNSKEGNEMEYCCEGFETICHGRDGLFQITIIGKKHKEEDHEIKTL